MHANTYPNASSWWRQTVDEPRTATPAEAKLEQPLPALRAPFLTSLCGCYSGSRGGEQEVPIPEGKGLRGCWWAQIGRARAVGHDGDKRRWRLGEAEARGGQWKREVGDDGPSDARKRIRPGKRKKRTVNDRRSSQYLS